MNADEPVLDAIDSEYREKVLTSPALAFLADMHRSFEPRRRELLRARGELAVARRDGATIDFLPQTREV
jgi:malate synthase